MEKAYRLFIILLFSVLTISVSGCSDDDKLPIEQETIITPETPDDNENREPENPTDENIDDNTDVDIDNDQSGSNNIIQSLNIRITINDNVVTATMYDNETSKDFLSKLPLTATLSDYASTEKIFYMPDNYKLSTEGAPSGYDPSAGDITLYAPWGNIAIFYRDYSYSNGLVPMSRIDGDGIKLFQVSGDLTATFEISE